jgi:GTP-sensing pleiotropic transcriptional regulator CodY
MTENNEFERRVETAVEMAKLTAAVVSNTESTEKVFNAMFGEDEEGGLVTQVALNKQSIGRVLKLTVGAVTTVFLWTVRGIFK